VQGTNYISRLRSKLTPQYFIRKCIVVILIHCFSITGFAQAKKQSAPNNDAVFMKGWVHREGRSFTYFVPHKDWLATETTNGIDLSSPTGDDLVSFAYVIGSQKTPQQVQSTVFQGAGIRNVMIVNRHEPLDSGSNVTQTIEFSGVSKTNSAIHGMLTAQVSARWFSADLVMAPESMWQKDARTLQAVRDHTTFMGRKLN
jgi:hypothetical protein